MNAHHKPLKIGLIGTGFMGKTHVYGYAIADRVFDLPYKLELVSVADVSEDLAQSAAPVSYTHLTLPTTPYV